MIHCRSVFIRVYLKTNIIKDGFGSILYSELTTVIVSVRSKKYRNIFQKKNICTMIYKADKYITKQKGSLSALSSIQVLRSLLKVARARSK